jgi:ubiquinol-cytochrome c reductase cytochrome b subunit
MMDQLLKWLDHRTGYKATISDALYENVPGGARWRYITGSMLVFAFVTQAITGLILWAAYSASSQTAWESVYYIQHEMTGGWFLRGVHHNMAQAMIILLVLHMLQVVIDGAYKPPREFNFWLGLILMLLVLGFALTGYLLPWDQKGFWATSVATNLSSLTPLFGDQVQQLAVGGSQYGHHTLTRFFALHAGLLPALMVMFLGMHVALFRRHGITAESSPNRPDQYFWPNQVLKDAIGCLVLVIVVAGAVFYTHGAELNAPADASEPYAAARPEWYFLFLFQMLKMFENEFIGAMVVPGVVMAFLFLMPLTGRIKMGHIVNVVVLIVLLVGAGYLTVEAWNEDHFADGKTKPSEMDFGGDEDAKSSYTEKFEASDRFLKAQKQADENYERLKVLIKREGIPKGGAIELQRNDPWTQGPKLFARHCQSCHSRIDKGGDGMVAKSPVAPNLYGIGSRDWLSGLLDPMRISTDQYFGGTALMDSDMHSFVTSDLADLDEDSKKILEKIIIAVSAEAKLPSQAKMDATAASDGSIAAGIAAFEEAFVVRSDSCVDCHKIGGIGDLGSAPDLTGWGSREWLKGMIANPNHERFYANSDNRMPAFAENVEDPTRNQLSDHELEMLVRWLRDEY